MTKDCGKIRVFSIRYAKGTEFFGELNRIVRISNSWYVFSLIIEELREGII